jgi:F0F1-type ATP synthase assembly protein I
LTGPPGDDARKRQRAAKRQGIAYQGAFEAFVAILVAMGIGYWLDQRFGTSPYGLLIGTGIGFASFVLRLLRLGRQIQSLSDAPDEPAGPSAKDPR